jgi:nicotinate-nucleotide adenylyltransferase
MRIAVCGGSFDPFHRGHIDPVLAVREAMGWDRVIYVPAFRQPFKPGGAAVSGHHRFAMAVLATQGQDDLYVTPMELERGDVSYTFDTLEELHRRQPGSTFDWIIGDDNVSGLPKWRNIERILELARFVVLTRGQSEGMAAPFREGTIVHAHNETVPVSATEIRRRLRAGEPVAEFVDPLVARYIQHNGLYREARE